MKTYYMTLDGLDRDTIEAESIREAMVIALDMAADGDWSGPQEGTEDEYGGVGDPVVVRVWLEDEDGDVIEEDRDEYIIPTLGDIHDAQLADDGRVLSEIVGEFSTQRIVAIDGEYYYQHANGGERGAHDRQGGDGVWRDRPVEPTRELDREEARAMLLDWGHSPADVSRMTR